MVSICERSQRSKASGAGLCLGRLLQQLGEMAQVGEAALAVGPGEQTAGHPLAGEQLAQRRADAALQPARAIGAEAGHVAEQSRLVGIESFDVGSALAEHFGGQRPAQQPLARWLEYGGQDPGQLFGLGAFEQAGIGELHAGHAGCAEGQPHVGALGVAAHEHGDVAAGERPSAKLDLAGLPGREEAGDLACAGGDGGLPGLGLGQRRAIGLARQGPQLQRCAWLAAVFEARPRLGAAGHRPIVEPGQHEGALVGAEERVEGIEQGARRALVVGQGVARRRLAIGLQIGVQVGVAKAVDGLLGIADEKQRRLGVAVEGLEDGELERIGILEFVDEGGPEAAAQRGGEGRAGGTGQALVHVPEHVVEGNDAA